MLGLTWQESKAVGVNCALHCLIFIGEVRSQINAIVLFKIDQYDEILLCVFIIIDLFLFHIFCLQRKYDLQDLPCLRLGAPLISSK